MTTLRMALRNISRQKKRTILLGGAIAFGVMIITLVGSLTAGLASAANDTFTDLLGGHIYIAGREVSESGRLTLIVGENEPLEEALSLVDAQIREIRFRSAASGEIIFGSRTTTVSLDGVDWEAEPTLYETLELVAGEIGSVSDERTVIVPEPVMEELGVQIGESVLIRVTSVTGQRNVGDFVIGGATPDAGTFGLGSAYVNRAYLNSLIGMTTDQYQRVNITVADTDEIEAVAAAIERELLLLGKINPAESDEEEDSGPGGHMGGGLMFGGSGFSTQVEEAQQWEGTQFRVTTINDVMEPVMTIVNILNQASLGLFLVLLIITMVGLLNTFRMILIERTREIGTIRAIGMQRGQVRNMFLLEALVLAVGGAIAGLAAAGVLALILGNIPMSTNTPLVMFLDGGTFAFPVNVVNIVGTMAILTVITVLSAYLPARKAARMRPADALRTSY